jgi:hypothetical protein
MALHTCIAPQSPKTRTLEHPVSKVDGLVDRERATSNELSTAPTRTKSCGVAIQQQQGCRLPRAHWRPGGHTVRVAVRSSSAADYTAHCFASDFQQNKVVPGR